MHAPLPCHQKAAKKAYIPSVDVLFLSLYKDQRVVQKFKPKKTTVIINSPVIHMHFETIMKQRDFVWYDGKSLKINDSSRVKLVHRTNLLCLAFGLLLLLLFFLFHLF